jgi:RNA polymerase subunit RPABC4/transcription elongation factor Spt4
VKCPRCTFAVPEEAEECPRCGVIFAKWQPRPVITRDDEQAADGRIARRELRILGIGLAVAIVIYAIPFLRFIFSTLETLFHELGHAVVAWLLGHPAIPAFDFMFGGGFTHQGAFHLPIALAVAAVFAWLGWRLRGNARGLVALGVIVAIWLVCVSADWRRETVIASAGVAFEFILAGILFYQALAGVGWRMPEIERPLGAFIAFFVQFNAMLFPWRLLHDPDFLAAYQEGKGGAIMNDLEVVALNLHIHTPLNPGIKGLAVALSIFSFVPISVALAWYLNREKAHRVLKSLLSAE